MSWTADVVSAGFSTGRPFRALSANRATHHLAAQQADPHSLLSHYQGLLDAQKTFYEFEFSVRSDDGRQVWHAISGEPMFNELCRFTGYRGIGVEVRAERG